MHTCTTVICNPHTCTYRNAGIILQVTPWKVHEDCKGVDCLQSSLWSLFKNQCICTSCQYPAAPVWLIVTLTITLLLMTYHDMSLLLGWALAVLIDLFKKVLMGIICFTNKLSQTSSQGISLFILTTDIQFNYFCWTDCSYFPKKLLTY